MTPLRKRMIEEMRMRDYSEYTISAYVSAVYRLAAFYHKSPHTLSREQILEFLLDLVEEKKVAWSYYKQVLAALRYFYRYVIRRGEIVEDIRGPRTARTLPIVLSVEEVARFFKAIPSLKHRTILMLAYGSGLRVGEAVRVRLADIVLRISQGKRKKDRYTLLSPALLDMLDRYCWAARPEDLLFTTSSTGRPITKSTVQRVCKEAQQNANPRHLGASQIGLLAVLHTWGQNLMHHPHLHCVVSGGGLSPDESRWIASRDYYFLPVKVLSRVFRNKFRHLLGRAFERGELNFYGKLIPLAKPKTFGEFLDAATRREWVVYAKRPFREPSCVLKYLARYTHRVAISNHRLVDYRDGNVTFRYKDYAREGAQRTMTLEAAEFIRRFLMHVLPSGFMRIRHYGYLANRYRRQKLEICRRLLGCDEPTPPQGDVGSPASQPSEGANEPETKIHCPVCKTGWMLIIDTFDRVPRRCDVSPLPSKIPYLDSS